MLLNLSTCANLWFKETVSDPLQNESVWKTGYHSVQDGQPFQLVSDLETCSTDIPKCARVQSSVSTFITRSMVDPEKAFTANK